MRRHLQNISNAQVGLLLLIFSIVGLGGSAFAHIRNENVIDATYVIDWWAWLDGALQNFGTEVIGALITFGLIEILVGNREKRQQEELNTLRNEERAESERKRDQLVAISELRRANSLKEIQPVLDRMKSANLLNGADLNSIDLSGTNLEDTNLENSDLSQCNLQNAKLQKSWIVKANLTKANLKGANLESTDLTNARLRGADLTGVNLRYANLDGTILVTTNLLGADLSESQLENVRWTSRSGGEPATLPDGTLWDKNENVKRFWYVYDPFFLTTLDLIDEIREQLGFEPIPLVTDRSVLAIPELNALIEARFERREVQRQQKKAILRLRNAKNPKMRQQILYEIRHYIERPKRY